MTNQEIVQAKEQVTRHLAEGRIGQETADTALAQLDFLRRHNDFMDDAQVLLEDPEGYLRRAASSDLPDFPPAEPEAGKNPLTDLDLDDFMKGFEET